MDVNYISGELIFSPGVFYAIDNYQEEPIYIYDTVSFFKFFPNLNLMFNPQNIVVLIAKLYPKFKSPPVSELPAPSRFLQF